MTGEHVTQMNEKLSFLNKSKEDVLEFPKLDINTLRLVFYSDASFANHDDKTSQLGYVICLADVTGKMTILASQSCKSLRVARSAMAAETLAFTAAFDARFVLQN